MGKILKWIFISACTVMFLLLVLLAGAHLYFKTDQGARRLSTFINTLYPGKITGSEMEVSLLHQEVSMKNAVCIGPDGRKVFTAERASLKINLRALLRKNLVFEFIKASKPDFVLELDKDGWLNIEAVFAEKTPGESPFNVYIRSLTCTDGTFTYRAGNGEPVVRLEHFNLNMDSSFERDTFMHFALPKAHMFLYVAGKRIDLGDGHASATILNDSIKNLRIATKKNTSRTDLTGSITGMSEKPQLHWDLAFDADMADLRDALGLGKDNTGRLKGIISARRDYDNPDLTCNLAYSGGHLGGLTISKAALNGTVIDRFAKIKELSGGLASGRLAMSGTVDLRQLFPDGYFEGIKDGEAVSYDLSLAGTDMNLSELPGIPRGMKGTLTSEMAIEGKGWNPETLSLNVSSLKARASGFTADGILKNAEISLMGRGAYQRGEVSLDPLIANTAGSNLTTRGKLTLSSGAITGTLNLTSPQISGLLARYGVNARGSLNAAATVSGTLKRPAADISLNTQNSAFEDITLGDVDMEGRLDPSGTLTINRCSVKNGGSTVEAAGSVQLFSDFPRIDPDPPIKIEADLTSLSLHDFTPSIPIKGPLSGRITANGSASSLSGDMKLHGSDISFADINLGTIELDALLDKGILTVSNLSMSKGRSSLRASGSTRLLQDNRLAVVPDPQIDFRTTGGSIFLEDFSDEAKGLISVRGDIKGTLRHPVGYAVITGNNLDLGVQRFSMVTIDAQLDGEEIWFDTVTAELSPGRRIGGTGWLSLQGEYSLDILSTDLPLESIDLFKERTDLHGTASIDITGKGTLNNPELSGKATIKGISIREKPLQEFSFTFEIKDRKATLAGAFNFDFHGRYDFGSGDYQASAVFDKTELEPYFALAGKPLLSGTVTGDIQAEGRAGNIDDINIQANFSTVNILLKDKKLVLAHDIEGSYHDGKLLIPKTHVELAETGWFDLSGSGSMKDSLVLDAEGILPVEVVGSFVEELSDGTGNIRFSTHIRSKGARHEVSSLITLEKFGYTIPYNGQRVHDTNGSIRIENSKASIDEITGQIDTGNFRIGGSAALDGYSLKEIDLYSQTKALPLVIPDMMDLSMDAQITLAGTKDLSLLKSDVVILEGTYYKDVKVDLITGVFERILPKPKQVRKQSQPAPWPFMKNIALDVTIKRRGDVTVENNIAELDINPDLKISGTLLEPIVTGRIAVTDGTVTFQNNEFTVSRGVIDFLNPHKTTASVDVKGETKVRDWTVDLTVEGELDNLQFELTSTPPETPDDILSLLIVGKTTRELTQNQTGMTVSSSGMMAELLANTYGSQVKKATSLDILKLETSEFTTTEKGENLKLTLGKEFSRRMTIKYEMETSNTETIQKGIAEYKILENLLINGYQGSNGIFGADFQFRYEFR